MTSPTNSLFNEEPPENPWEDGLTLPPIQWFGEQPRVEISIPGDVFGVQYGAIRVELDAGDLAKLPRFLSEELLKAGQEAFDIAKQYKADRTPAPLQAAQQAAQQTVAGGYAQHVSPQAAPMAQAPQQSVQGTGPAAVQALVSGAALPLGSEGLVSVTIGSNQYPTVFPSLAALPKQQFEEMVVAEAAAALQLPVAWLAAFDNRSDILAGTSRVTSIASVKFATRQGGAPAEVQAYTTNDKGYQQALTFVDWNKTNNTVKLKKTRILEDNFMNIALAAAPYLTGGS